MYGYGNMLCNYLRDSKPRELLSVHGGGGEKKALENSFFIPESLLLSQR